MDSLCSSGDVVGRVAVLGRENCGPVGSPDIERAVQSGSVIAFLSMNHVDLHSRVESKGF